MLWQLVVNGLASGATLSLLAVSLRILYRTGRFFDFSHGAVFAVGGYVAYALLREVQMPLVLSLLCAILTAGVAGWLLDRILYRHLRNHLASANVCLLASLGVLILAQNAIAIGFGDDVKMLRESGAAETLSVFGSRLTYIQIWGVMASAVILSSVGIGLWLMPFGKTLQAISCDPSLSVSIGIKRDQKIGITVFLASSMAGTAGILIGFDQNLTPGYGLRFLMLAIVASVIGGGKGLVQGSVVGAFLLCLCQHVGIWKVSSEWQDAIALGLLLVFLLVRPEGILRSDAA